MEFLYNAMKMMEFEDVFKRVVEETFDEMDNGNKPMANDKDKESSSTSATTTASPEVNEVATNCFYCSKESKDLKKCNDCKSAFYCDRQCQKEDWRQHKVICRSRSNKTEEKTDSASSSNQKENFSVTTALNVQHKRPIFEYVPCFYCDTPREELKKCTKCEVAKYCDRNCQKAHWKKHKVICDLLYQRKNSVDSTLTDSTVALRAAGFQNLKSENKKTCQFCYKHQPNLIKCSKCNCVEYCDERCEVNHRMMHEKACESYPLFTKALESSCELLALANQVVGTTFEMPPMPNFILSMMTGRLERKEKKALLLLVVAPFHHPIRHGAFVQDVNGDMTHVLFYHDVEEEKKYPFKISKMLQPGNFIHWFFPRWRCFVDGKYGFRIDSLNEIEFLEASLKVPSMFDFGI